MVAPTCFGITLLSSGNYPGAWRYQIATLHVTRHNTPIHNILSTARQLSISQKALGTLPEDVNVMPKDVGANMLAISDRHAPRY
jgi:hypothetical protein